MKILIIEDEVKLAKSLKQGLEQEGYAVDYLLDGESGERRLIMNKRDYDLVILDRMLPGKDGVAVCTAWREAKIATPILMLTAKDTLEDKVLGLNSGADDYLVKPFAFEELIARVRALLRRPTEAVPVDLVLNNLQLNSATREATFHIQPLQLTLKEFVVLEYLMRHPNQVIPRDQLLDHGWDFSFASFSNTVDVHIKNIRKKLHAISKEQVIETVRGLGYRLKG